MNPHLPLLLVLAGALAGVTATTAAVLNDGTTTTTLARLSNQNEAGAALARLSSSNGVLYAEQTGLPGNLALRTTWYSAGEALTGGVYTVRADFQPAALDPRHRGGVMGWLNPAAGKGIGLYLAPGGTQPQLSVVAVDFLATEPDDNEGFALLYNLDGSPASADFSSARAMVSGHDATRFATFQLEFSAPTDTDRQLTNVTPTARITARAWQVDANNASNQLGRAIELLTDLPPPGGLDHRVGYYAYLGSIFVDGAIGQLDNLVVEGGTAPVPNSRPTIALTSPTNNTEYLAPTNIVIEAEASDSDGEIVDVRFFANSTELGVLTEPPYSVTWTNPPAGTYTLTARATDNRGARTTSAAVAISVRTNNPPTVAVASPANNSTYAAPALIPIEVNAADADGTVTQVRVLVNGSELFAATSPPYRFEWNAVPEGNYELIALATDDLGAETASTPVQVRVQSDLGAPALAIRRETASVVISWPAGFAGFRLEGNTNLASTNWATISTADTSATIPISSAVSRFFRLRRP